MSKAGQRLIESATQALAYATVANCCCSLCELGHCCRQPKLDEYKVIQVQTGEDLPVAVKVDKGILDE